LGQAFGTRKAKQAINAYERNQVDVNMLGGAVSEQISSQIDGKATVLATADDIEREMNANRLVPPFNDQTEKVELIYPFEQLITTDELDALPYHALMQYKKKDFKELRENGYVLYTQRCTLNDVYDYDYKRTYPMYVMERLEPSIIQKNVKRVQSLLYLTYLLRFREMKDHQLSRSDRFQEAMMVPVPSVVQERLLSLFTERQDGKKPGQTVQRINNSLRAKLTAYICALCLHIDSFAVNCGSLAQDLKIPVSKTQDLFKQIGCTSETKKIGDETVKMARLTAPLRFPKPPKGMRAKRQ
jgi:DNA-directed RNA polymerase I subunit RPA49